MSALGGETFFRKLTKSTSLRTVSGSVRRYAPLPTGAVPGGSKTCTLVAVLIAEHASEDSDGSTRSDGAALGMQAVIRSIDPNAARKVRYMPSFYGSREARQ